MINDYIQWCYNHGNAGYLLLIVSILGVIYLGAAILGSWSDRS